MGASLAKGTILGGLVVFVYGAISWMVLPWNAASLSKFTNGDAVAQVVQNNAPKSGVYVAPMGEDPASQEKMARGPMIFTAVRLGPMGNMGIFFARQFLIQALGALLISALMLKAKPQTYGGKVLFVVGIAATVGVLGHLPSWNWWSFSTGYTLAQCGDLLVGWGLAGLVLAKVVK